MAERCESCGREITGILSDFPEHAGKVSFWTSMDYGKEKRAMGGRCGRCGKLCCSDCYSNGACPSCRATLKQGGSQYY